MNVSELRIGEIEVGKIILGYATGILVHLTIRLEDEGGSGMAQCDLEVTLAEKDWSISELKAAAIDEAYRVLETLVSHRAA